MQAACDAPSCRQAGGSRRQGTAATAGHHRQDKQRPQGCKPPCSRGACAPSGKDARTRSSAQGPASRGSRTPALPKGRARQGVPEDRLQGRLDGPQDGWSGWRLVGVWSCWRLVGVSGLRPGLESPLLRHWRSGTGRRRKDEGEACRQALPRRCQTGACPGRQLRSLWDAVPEAGQRLADAADSRRGRKGCMPGQTATGAGFRQSVSGALAAGTAQERRQACGWDIQPASCRQGHARFGKTRPACLALAGQGRLSSGPVPGPVQRRSSAVPGPLLNSSSPLGSPSAFPRKPRGEPRTASDSLGQGRVSPGQCRAVPAQVRALPDSSQKATPSLDQPGQEDPSASKRGTS